MENLIKELQDAVAANHQYATEEALKKIYEQQGKKFVKPNIRASNITIKEIKNSFQVEFANKEGYIGYYVSIEEPKNKKLIQRLIDIKQQLIADIQNVSGVGFYIFESDASYVRLDITDKALQVTLKDLQVLPNGQILITAKYENADFVEEETKEISDFSMAEIIEIIKHIK